MNRNSNQSKLTQVTSRTRRKSHSGGEEGAASSVNNNDPNWDTDFKGNWEMGRDLIKEFRMKENNRNRSTSESAVSGLKEEEEEEDVYQECEENDNTSNAVSTPTSISSNSNVDHFNTADIVSEDIAKYNQQKKLSYSFADEGYSTHENLTMLSDIAYLNPKRRLYERDISNDSISSPISDLIADEALQRHPSDAYFEQAMKRQQSDVDYAQFKAKFDNRMEALWKRTDVMDSSIQQLWNDDNEEKEAEPPSIWNNSIWSFRNFFEIGWNVSFFFHLYYFKNGSNCCCFFIIIFI